MKRCLVYTFEGIPVKSGDIVEVDYQGVLHTAVVKSVFETDDWNRFDLVRIPITRKLHTNTAKAAVRKRFNEFKDIRIRTERKTGRKFEKKVIGILGEDYQRRILKYVCLGNLFNDEEDHIRFIYANNSVLLKKDKHGHYIIIDFDKSADFNKCWIMPQKFKDYYDQLYLQY